MMTNYLVNVPKLKGRENYSEWAFAAENFLVLEGMSDCIKSETVPEAMGAASDAKTKAKLILTIDSSLYVHIKSVATTYELWQKLKNLFDDSGFTRRISLLRSLISIRLENSASMTSYVSQIIETSQKLSGTGFNINDEWVASLLLAGLTEKYSPMIMAIEHCGIPLTADAIKTKLLDMEETETGNGGDTKSANGAFASFKKNRNVGSTATKDNTNAQMSKSKPKVISCYKCKQTGHYRNQCPVLNINSPNTNKNERTSSNAFSAVFLNGEFGKKEWYIDSGASVHLTANEEWMSNTSRNHVIKDIVVANKDRVPVSCTGDVQLKTKTHTSEYDIQVKDVLCVPKLTTNLLSVSQLIAKGNRVSFNNDGCQIFNQAGVLVATATLLNGVYKLNLTEDCSEEVSMVPVGDDIRDSVGESTMNESLNNSNSSTSVYSDADSDSDDTLLTVNDTDISLSEAQKMPEVTQKRTRKAPDRYGHSNLCVSTTVPEVEQIMFSEVLAGPEAEQWRLAMLDELQSFEYNNAWELVDVPSGVPIVKCKWVLNKKVDVNDKVRYRARLVAKGFTQRRGIDYVDTFSPVVKHSTLRMLFALSVQCDMDITHLDVTTAFLNGHLKEDIYMCIPEGFVNDNKCNGKVLKLKRAIYGLKQSSFVWYERVKDCLCKLNFKISKYEPCLFTKMYDNVKIIITIYVDDFLIFSNSPEETEKLKCVLGSEFKLKDLGPVRRYLGMRINVDKNSNTITVDQEKYIEQILAKFDMSECRSIDTPIESKLNIEKSENCKTDIPYQRLIGSLMYLAVLTRPDIAYSVSYLSQFNNCYNENHYSYAKRVLKYLNKTKNYCLKYTKENVDLKGFVDADWASDSLDRKSYTGYCFTMSGSVISWQSRKQKTVSLSSTEAEYVALSEASKEAVYLRNLMYELTGKLCVMKLHCDNQSALKLAASQQSQNRSKHIDVRYHYVRDAIRNKLIVTEYISTQEMPADLLTKGLLPIKHYKFMKMLGIIPKLYE